MARPLLTVRFALACTRKQGISYSLCCGYNSCDHLLSSYFTKKLRMHCKAQSFSALVLLFLSTQLFIDFLCLFFFFFFLFFSFLVLFLSGRTICSLFILSAVLKVLGFPLLWSLCRCCAWIESHQSNITGVAAQLMENLQRAYLSNFSLSCLGILLQDLLVLFYWERLGIREVLLSLQPLVVRRECILWEIT